MKIPIRLLQALREQNRAGLESCGVLWGGSPDCVCDFSAYPGPLYPHRFEMSPRWLLQECRARRARKQEALGFYHFHPEAEVPEPSARDLQGHPLGSIALILSGQGSSVRAFQRRDCPDRFEETQLFTT